MFLYNWYIDPLYLWVFVITLVISIATQAYLRSTYGKWSHTKNSAGLNGIQVGKRIIQQTRLGVLSQAQCQESANPTKTTGCGSLAYQAGANARTNDRSL